MTGPFTVVFSDAEQLTFPESARFEIKANVVLVITDGDEVRRFAPHAWREVRGGSRPPRRESLGRVITSS
jgi:hypothetical protein